MGCDRLDPKGMEASRLEMSVVGGGRWRSMITLVQREIMVEKRCGRALVRGHAVTSETG